jgi:hypothetical protein
MAITPKEALGSKMEKEAEAIEALEKEIDAKLVAGYNGRGAVPIHLPNGLGDFVWAEVKKRFEAAGWDVRSEGDQRDGYYWAFKPTMGRDDRMDR